VPASAVFVSEPGVVIALPSDYDFAPVPLTIEGWENMGIGRAIRTGFGISRRAIYQLQPSLERSQYLYPFGEGPGRFQLAGLLAAKVCGTDGVSGLESLNAYFDTYSAAYRAQPLAIGVGSTTSGLFEGILVDLNASVGSDPSGVALGNFSLDFVTFPRKSVL
jgi:hypothetical protein